MGPDSEHVLLDCGAPAGRLLARVSMSRRRSFKIAPRAVVVGAWVALAGCGKPASGNGAASSASASPTTAAPAEPHLVTSELSSATAFELTLREGGLRLLWATPDGGAGWLRSSDLAQDGRPTLPPRSVPVPARGLGRVTDLAAAPLGEELALAWIDQGKAEARAEALVLSGPKPGLLDLGPAALSADSARGNIVLAAEREQSRALVMWRGLGSPCVDPASPSACVGFSFRRISTSDSEPTGLPMSVPVPCTSHSVELAVSAGRFHYGVCTREGNEPVTTMFSIQYEPEYARAEPLLKGCLPLGTVDVASEPWLIGDCHGKRKAAKVPLTDEPVQTEAIDALQISCTPERAELRQGRFVLALREPRAGLQAVLPPALLPSGGRAGWTGKSLVVAYWAGARLETRAFACRGGTLRPL